MFWFFFHNHISGNWSLWMACTQLLHTISKVCINFGPKCLHTEHIFALVNICIYFDTYGLFYLPIYLRTCTMLFLNFFFCFFLYSLIYMCIHCLGHLSPLPPILSLSLASRQNLFCPYLQFCWREDISNNKDSIFASWDNDSYAERFLALLLCTSVLQLELIHLYLISSLFPGHLPILTSVVLKLLY
jgi:hypothetical protein